MQIGNRNNKLTGVRIKSIYVHFIFVCITYIATCLNRFEFFFLFITPYGLYRCATRLLINRHN